MAEAAFRQPEDRERAGKSSLVVFSSRGWRKNVCVRARARALHPGRELDSWIPCFWSGGAETPSTCWSMCWSENSELNDPSVVASPAPRTPPTPKNPGHAPTLACVWPASVLACTPPPLLETCRRGAARSPTGTRRTRRDSGGHPAPAPPSIGPCHGEMVTCGSAPTRMRLMLPRAAILASGVRAVRRAASIS